MSEKVFSELVVINRPQQDVWDFITTSDNWENWYSEGLTDVSPGWQKGATLSFVSGQKPVITQYAPAPGSRKSVKAICCIVLLLGMITFSLGCDAPRYALHTAAFEGDLQKVQDLLEDGSNVNLKKHDDYDATPLHMAAGEGHIKIVALLLEHGADANARLKKYGTMPLHFAAVRGHTEIAALLLEHGANVNAGDSYGFTPLHFALEHNCIKTADLMRQHGGRE